MVHSYILANDTPILSEMWVQKNQMSIHAVACNKADIHEDFWIGSGLTLYIYFCNDAMPPVSKSAWLHLSIQSSRAILMGWVAHGWSLAKLEERLFVPSNVFIVDLIVWIFIGLMKHSHVISSCAWALWHNVLSKHVEHQAWKYSQT